ncbi:hydroxyacylglutathione hydrolase [Cavenderia fasciculata]|uniref:Hydroxyacylglutathione hydrolase n=1 Tax=Cavenderia fasciculata TaxID=261658 RepID=F4PVN9_CACFS|nr:hydroxyacylglutathione hydrolase [Cavenderia fasciculata]EGG20053.1 hydroxyacylglutathione hydrolase [Cavenderia fasciculata]|eukprot:XP_004367036.1 hydroxyacylglutathione hydrolase [Cavenderia fasciculata]
MNYSLSSVGVLLKVTRPTTTATKVVLQNKKSILSALNNSGGRFHIDSTSCGVVSNNNRLSFYTSCQQSKSTSHLLNRNYHTDNKGLWSDYTLNQVTSNTRSLYQPRGIEHQQSFHRSFNNKYYSTTTTISTTNKKKDNLIMENKANVSIFPDKDSATGQVLIVDESTKKCAILDSVLNYAQGSGRTSTTSVDKIVDAIKERGLTVEWILESHIHADHLSAAFYLKGLYPQAKTAIGAGTTVVQKTFKTIYNLDHDFPVDGSQFNVLWKDNDTFKIGNLNVHVYHTPGHTPSCVSYYIENDSVFVGDTIFMPDVGTARCDFPNGSAATLFESTKKILSLPDHVQIYVCHDYPPPERQLCYVTTVAEEKSTNKHLKDGTTKEQFIEMRTARDATLSTPQLLIPSIQVNIRAGQLPEAESNGISYIKIPINYFK